MKTHKAKPRKAIVRPRAVKGGDATAPSLERDAGRIIKMIESGRSAFVWCKDGRRADDAIDAASKRLSSAGYKAIDMLLPVSYHPTYEGNFSSRVGKSLYPDSETEMDEVALRNRLKKEKRRIVIFMTRLNFAVQGNAATPQMNSWARFLVSLLECIPANKVFLIIGSSMSPAEMKERFTESEPLPFKDDQVIDIDYKDDGHQTSSVGKNTSSIKVKRAPGKSSHPGMKLGKFGRVAISPDGKGIEFKGIHFKVTARYQWEYLDLLFECADRHYKWTEGEFPPELFGYVKISKKKYAEFKWQFRKRSKTKGEMDPWRLINDSTCKLIEVKEEGRFAQIRIAPKLAFPERFPK